MFKKFLAVMLSLVVVLSLAGCSAKKDTTETDKNNGTTATTTPAATDTAAGTFKLGGFLQLSGGNSQYGNEAKNSIALAVKYINEQGGFNGQQIEFIPYDTQGAAEEAVKVATKLIEQDKVNAVIGSVNSGEVLAAAGYLNDAKIITFGLGTAASWMAEDWPYVFRATMNNSTAAPLTADMLKEMGLASVAVFYGQDDASLATSQIFAKECESRGISVLANESYDTGDMDFSAQIANIINSKAQSVYISVIGETGPVIVKQLRQYGYNGLIFDKESFMQSQIAIAGEEAANYILFANPYVTYATAEDCDIPVVKDFLDKYTAEYGENAKTDSAYRGWDTMMVLWEASKIAKSNDSDSLRDAVAKISGLAGLGGTLDYTSGTREGYTVFNRFVLVGGKNVLFDKWLADGGYDAYKTATGREY